MVRHLVLVGGGHAHLTVMLNLREYTGRGHRVTLISPSSHQYYSGMGPGMLSGIYRPQEIRFHIKKMVEDRGAKFIQDAVVRVDANRRILFLRSGGEVPYDVVSFNTGSDVPMEVLETARNGIYPVKPIINLLHARTHIVKEMRRRPLNIVVLGGGPAGVEIAGNVMRLVRDNGGQAQVTLVVGSRVFHRFAGRIRERVRCCLERTGVEVREGAYARSVEEGMVTLTDGTKLKADIVFAAMGTRPSTLFRDSRLPTGADGGLLVNAHLQCATHPEIFGGGDCISLAGHDLEKVGVYAVRQNPILHHNLLAALEDGALRSFRVRGRYHYTYLLIFNMGDGTGVLRKGFLLMNGKLAFRLKDYIDRRFMRTFQVSGELDEPDDAGA